MANSYTRQSSAQIVDGQVINASDFNNEYNQLVLAFSGTVGHDHSGGPGLGPLINLTATTPGVSGILDAQFGGVHTAAVDPTAAECTPLYVKGAVWVNTVNKTIFVCIDNTAATAVWSRLDANVFTGATTIPLVTDDLPHGYVQGSIQYNSTQNVFYLCTSATAGAATWVSLAVGRTGVSTIAPTTTDDINKGYRQGSVWIETTTPNVYICTSNTANAATWVNVTFNVGFIAMIAQTFAKF